MTITIYHNPACGTSRNTLALIRGAEKGGRRDCLRPVGTLLEGECA